MNLDNINLLKIKTLTVLMIIFTFTKCDWNYEARPFIENVSKDVSALTVTGKLDLTDVSFRVIEYGHCWSTNTNAPMPTIDGMTTFFGSTSTTVEEFTSNLINLESDKTIYYRGYATDSNGVNYFGLLDSIMFGTEIWKPVFCNSGNNLGARAGGISFVVNNEAYVGLGVDGSYRKDMKRYNFDQNCWEDVMELPYDGDGLKDAISFVINDVAYVGGGWEYTDLNNKFWKYVNDVWVEIDSLPLPEGLAQAAVASDGTQALLVGGREGFTPSTSTTNKTWLFKDGSWSQKEDFEGGSRRNMVGFYSEGKFYFGLGLNDEGNSENNFWTVNSTFENWSDLDLDMSFARVLASTFVIDNVAYVGLGKKEVNDVNSLNDLFVLENNTWREITTLDQGPKTNSATSFVLNGNGYVVGGFKETGGASDKVWKFYP